jgi:hypothetical protein
MHISILVLSSDLLGVNPATYDRMVLYYCLNDQSGSVLGDSTVLSWAGCHNRAVPEVRLQWRADEMHPPV